MQLWRSQALALPGRRQRCSRVLDTHSLRRLLLTRGVSRVGLEMSNVAHGERARVSRASELIEPRDELDLT
jgi:hypothetical protein